MRPLRTPLAAIQRRLNKITAMFMFDRLIFR